MVESRIQTVRYDNGEIQRYQIVSGFAWKDLEFVQPEPSKECFDELARMFKMFMIAQHKELYGAMLAFHVPEDIEIPFSTETEFGKVFDKHIAASIGLRKLVKEGRIRNENKTLVFDDPEVEGFINSLEERGFVIRGFGDRTEVSIVAVGADMGYLSGVKPQPKLICNSHFFIFDLTDHDSPYDILGTPFGMIVKDGMVSQPPLNDREALVVDLDGKASIVRPALENMSMDIQGRTFKHGENCTVYRRPKTRLTPKEDGLDLIIVGDEVVAVHQGGQVMVPMAGFVLHTTEDLEICPSPVVYHGFEDCMFGIQVGSSAVKDGVAMEEYGSPFYSLGKDSIPFPPTLYPQDYQNARAPRMAICSDADNDPVIIWAEGASKLYYQHGKESCGASLLELARYCKSIGMVNAINLDGGGSAEIFLDGKLCLHVSDRYLDNTDAERPVPMGLLVR